MCIYVKMGTSENGSMWKCVFVKRMSMWKCDYMLKFEHMKICDKAKMWKCAYLKSQKWKSNYMIRCYMFMWNCDYVKCV